MKKDSAAAKETVSAEPSDAPNYDHFIKEMAKVAKKENKPQRKVLGSWTSGKKSGEEVLIVRPDGSFEIERSK